MGQPFPGDCQKSIEACLCVAKPAKIWLSRGSSIWRVYQATIQSLLLYGYPCFCNAPQKLMNFFMKVESRAKRIIFDQSERSRDVTSLSAAGDMQCQRLFQQVLRHVDHPLRIFFEPRQPTPRNALILKRPRSRTVRFKNSFIRYCAQLSIFSRWPVILPSPLSMYFLFCDARTAPCVPIKTSIIIGSQKHGAVGQGCLWSRFFTTIISKIMIA